MRNLIQQSVLTLLMTTFGFNIAQAAPTNINITGTVVPSPCVVNNNNSNLNVELGPTIQAAALTTAGAGSALTPFNLSLTACPAGTNSVKVTFSGTPDTTSTTMYKNTGTATNLAVELSQQTTGTILGNNSTLTQTVQPDKTVTYALNARAYSAAGSVMPGSIIAVIQANFTYN
ncbi:putative mannose-resistant/Proteus-like fimbrial protein [Yersinia aldovae]|nr:putative mannose-resistant/Proteus-like fimbrial protein [Yersinia aldovae]